jgi:predicted amidohydrolase YtcJ
VSFWPDRCPLVRVGAAVALAASCSTAQVSAPATSASAPAGSADLVLRGGIVHTEDAKQPEAEALAVRGGRIVFVGSSAEAGRLIGAGTRVVELGGQVVIPGIHDAHVHPVSGGLAFAHCALTNAPEATVLAEVRACAASHPTDAWLLGRGWGPLLAHDVNPKKELLDAIEPSRPVALTSASGHSLWVNSAALRLANLTSATPDPAMGRIERDPATRAPTGTLQDAAEGLVLRVVPPPSRAELAEALGKALAVANGYGITSLFEASASHTFLETYQDADRRGALTARIRVAMGIDAPLADSPAALEHFVKARATYASTLVRPEAIKVFADGVFASHTAALDMGYANKPEDHGSLIDPSLFRRIVKRYEGAGFQIHVHAIGDRATHTALDVFEAAQKEGVPPQSVPPVIAHLALVVPADIARFAADGVVADIQPLWAREPRPNSGLKEDLGEARLKERMPIASFARAGVHMAAGSDWPVSSMDPFDGMEAAVTRASRVEPGLAVSNPDERVDIATILRAYTIGGAYAMREEHETGSLEVGKAADFAVLDRDPLTIPSTDIHKVKVLSTWLLGRQVFPVKH